MKLLEIIHERLVIPEMQATNKLDAIEELVDHLVAEHEIPISDRSLVWDAVLKREETISTGMTDNVAIPHAAADVLEDTIGVLGISHSGIPFDSIDGADAKLICLLVYPQGTFRTHVRTLAGIARLMSMESFRQDLINAKSVEKVIEVIREAEKGQIEE